MFAGEKEIVLKSEYEALKSTTSRITATDLRRSAASALTPNSFKTARESLSNESERSAVATGCSGFDETLGGGLRRGHLTEIYGESGCGKTQIALQVACCARESGAVYLCTEGAFPSERLQDMLRRVDRARCGDRIFVSQLIEAEDVVDCVERKLPALLRMRGDVSVVILDSVAAPFGGTRGDASSNATRTRYIKRIGIGLIECAKTYNLAVLCVNRVSANFDSERRDDTVPCLGLAWSNLVTTRIDVKKTNRLFRLSGSNSDRLNRKKYESETRKTPIGDLTVNIRRLKVVFSPNLPNFGTDFVITPSGVTGVG